MRSIKDEDQKVLVRNEEIKERWKEYFNRLFNGSSNQDLGDFTIQCQDINRNYMRRISESEVKKALKRMNQEKLLAQMEFLLRYGDLKRDGREMANEPL